MNNTTDSVTSTSYNPDTLRECFAKLIINSWNSEEQKKDKLSDKEKRLLTLLSTFPKDGHTERLLQVINVALDLNLVIPGLYNIGDLAIYNGHTCAIFGRVNGQYYSLGLAHGNPIPSAMNLGDGSATSVSRTVSKAQYEQYLQDLRRMPTAKILSTIGAGFYEPGMTQFLNNMAAVQ